MLRRPNDTRLPGVWPLVSTFTYMWRPQRPDARDTAQTAENRSIMAAPMYRFVNKAKSGEIDEKMSKYHL